MLIKEKCETCDAWLRVNNNSGLCRAHPAQPLFLGFGQQFLGTQPSPMIESHFPTMLQDGWCREWRDKSGAQYQ